MNWLAPDITTSVVSDVVNDQRDGTATIHATGPNIVSTAPTNLGGTITGAAFTVADPNLGPLQDNGGFTPTMSPQSGSPAIDAGSNDAAAGLTTDQRDGDFVRMVNGTVDIGAVEVPLPPPVPPPAPPPVTHVVLPGGTGQQLAVGGATDGSVRVYTPVAGQFTDAAAVTVFPGTGANVRTAVGDVDGDGTPDLIAVTGPGTPVRVAVVSGADNSTLLVAPFDPFGADFTGGGFVAAGDFDSDGRAEFVVTPDQGGGPRVTIFSLVDGTAAVRADFFGIDDPGFRGGARVGTGDVNGDGTPDLAVCAGSGGGPRVALYDGLALRDGRAQKLVGDFFAFEDVLRDGAYVAVGDVDADGFGDIVFGAGSGGSPRVLVVSGQQLLTAGAAALASPLATFFVANTDGDRAGVRVAATDADGDARADLAVGTGEGHAGRVRVYLGADLTTGGEPAAFQDLDPFAGAALADGVFVG